MSNISELSKWLSARAETSEALSAIDRQKMAEAAKVLERLVALEAGAGQPVVADEIRALAGALAEARAETAKIRLEREALATKLYACRWFLRHYRALRGSVKKLNLEAVIADLEQAVEHGRVAVPVSEIVANQARERSVLVDEALRLITHARDLLRAAEIRHLARMGIISGEDARRFEEAILNPDRLSPEELERAQALFDRVERRKSMRPIGTAGALS